MKWPHMARAVSSKSPGPRAHNVKSKDFIYVMFKAKPVPAEVPHKCFSAVNNAFQINLGSPAFMGLNYSRQAVREPFNGS